MVFIFVFYLHAYILMIDFKYYLADEILPEYNPAISQIIKTLKIDHFDHLPHLPHTSLASFLISEIQTLAKIPTKF